MTAAPGRSSTPVDPDASVRRCRRPNPFVTLLLFLLLAASLATAVAGIGIAVVANSPDNRRGNPLAQVGVVAGVLVLVVGALVALLIVLALLVRSRGRR